MEILELAFTLKTQSLCSEETSVVAEGRFILTAFVLADLNKALGNTMDAHEAAQMHQNFSQQLLQDHIAACSLPEHNLISVRETDQHRFLKFPYRIQIFTLVLLRVCRFVFYVL